MRRKSVILGLVLLVIGCAALVWCLTDKRKELRQAAYYKRKHALEMEGYAKEYNEWLAMEPAKRSALPWGLDEHGKAKLRAQLAHEQRERLRADMDKLASSERDTFPFADIIYGNNWRQEVEKYKERKETRELAVTASIVCMVAGGSIFAWWMGLWLLQVVITGWSVLRKFFADLIRGRRRATGKLPAETPAEEDEETLLEELNPDEQRDEVTTSDGGDSEGSCGREGGASGRGRIARLLAGDESVIFEEPSKHKAKGHKKKTMGVGLLEGAPEDILPDTRVERSKLEDSLKSQTENLEKQMAEFKQMTQTVQEKALEHSEPLKNGLMELTEQVAAIRDYASAQQDRVEKLQDGYDWNIIRNFCLRVIRCIDNLEERISRESGEGADTSHLEDVRDELIFALESSGVEQFEPEVNSDYRGQEKWAEAVKGREKSEEAKMSGKIAKVIRPGYRYVVDEENAKVVRAAQVKLFG
jgi:molecular chaperone GrpE (heat shock protein)